MSGLHKVIAAITGIASVISSFITIFIFISNVFSGKESLNFNSMISLVVILFIYITLGIGLILYSGYNHEVDFVFVLFSNGYIISAALLFGIFSYNCITYSNYTVWDFVNYFIIITFIIVLGASLGKLVSINFEKLSIPFVLVCLGQFVYLMKNLLLNYSLMFNHDFQSNFALIILSGIYICLFYFLENVEL